MFGKLAIVILLLSQLCSSLNSNDFCRGFTHEVVGKYDQNTYRYEVETHPEKCSHRSSPYIYQCDEELCAKNETECSKYMRMKIILKNEWLRTFFRVTILSHEQITKKVNLEIKSFQRFLKRVRNCSRLPYKWEANDMCLRKRKCYQEDIKYVKLWILEIKKTQGLKQTSCPCIGKHTYECGHVCSVNKEACDSFEHKNVSIVLMNERHLAGIGNCLI